MGVTGRLVDREGATEVTLERASLEGARERGVFFWLDLHRPRSADLDLLADVFGFHPLAIEDSQHFGQRPKLEEYADFVFLVVYGWSPDEDGLVEVHCYYSEHLLVTIRRDEAPALDSLRRRSARALARAGEGILVLHQVVDALVDSFFPVVDRFGERLELVEDGILERASEHHVQEILSMRRRIAVVRKVIGPQRDLFARLLGGGTDIPGMTEEAKRYFRDVYDHLFRLAEMIDAERELMASAIDLYLSAASNRLGAVTKQLTVIATVFLPLTFVTGFFGQNFGWMVENVDSPVAFLVFGLGIQLAAITLLLVYFKRQGWF